MQNLCNYLYVTEELSARNDANIQVLQLRSSYPLRFRESTARSELDLSLTYS